MAIPSFRWKPERDFSLRVAHSSAKIVTAMMLESNNHRRVFILAAFFSAFFMAACASKERIRKRRPVAEAVPTTSTTTPSRMLKSAKPYTVMGATYYPLADAYGYEKEGIASWYGPKFHGRRTSSGEVYNMDKMTAAHKTLPLQTMVEVTRRDTGKKIVVRVNDRGPFVAGRIIDLSREAARRLGMLNDGTAPVKIVALAKGRRGPKGAPPIPAEPPPDFEHGRFWAQVGAFGVRENAERVRERLLFPHDKIRLQPVTMPDGLRLTRVQVGPFTDMTSAQKALTDVMGQGFAESFIVAD